MKTTLLRTPVAIHDRELLLISQMKLEIKFYEQRFRQPVILSLGRRKPNGSKVELYKQLKSGTQKRGKFSFAIPRVKDNKFKLQDSRARQKASVTDVFKNTKFLILLDTIIVLTALASFTLCNFMNTHVCE